VSVSMLVWERARGMTVVEARGGCDAWEAAPQWSICHGGGGLCVCRCV
jgi:hypothetical protein